MLLRRRKEFSELCRRLAKRCRWRLRKLATRALSQFPDFRHQDILRSRREETLRRVKAAAFVTAFFEHASRGKYPNTSLQ
jgi:hypothetical protein